MKVRETNLLNLGAGGIAVESKTSVKSSIELWISKSLYRERYVRQVDLLLVLVMVWHLGIFDVCCRGDGRSG
jgi:hypothetical protein